MRFLINAKFLSCYPKYSYLFLINNPFVSHLHCPNITLQTNLYPISCLKKVLSAIRLVCLFYFHNYEFLYICLTLNHRQTRCLFRNKYICIACSFHETECPKWAKLLTQLHTNQAIFSSLRLYTPSYDYKPHIITTLIYAYI